MTKRDSAITKAVKSDQPNAFDNAVMVLGFLEPVFAVPQLLHIYSNEEAAGLSLATWLLYLLSSMVMIWWGLRRKLRPIYIPQMVWIFLELAIIYGIIKYS